MVLMRVEAMIDADAGISGEQPPQPRTLEAEASTYEEAKAQLAAQVPEGHKMLWLRVLDRA